MTHLILEERLFLTRHAFPTYRRVLFTTFPRLCSLKYKWSPSVKPGSTLYRFWFVAGRKLSIGIEMVFNEQGARRDQLCNGRVSPRQTLKNRIVGWVQQKTKKTVIYRNIRRQLINQFFSSLLATPPSSSINGKPPQKATPPTPLRAGWLII